MTDAELAILSIIAEGPIHGYDVQTVIAERGIRAWAQIGVSSIYYVLEKLERQGLIESTVTQDAVVTARRLYRITTAGMGVLQTAIADLIGTPREHADEFELGLANLPTLRPDQVRTALTAYRQELASRLAQARERRAALLAAQAPFHIEAMLSHRVALLEAELAWIESFVAAWEAQAPPDEPTAVAAGPDEVPRMKQLILPHDPDSPHRRPTRHARRTPPTLLPVSAAPPASDPAPAPADDAIDEHSAER
jgi:DNA-binding PadR family transcriptional regulator